MGTLAVGSIIARAIGLGTMPLLTRMYEPAHFGALSIFSAIILTTTPLLSLRYVVAIPLPKTNGLAFNLVALSLFSITAVGALLAFVFSFLAPFLLSALSVDHLIPYWGLLITGIILLAIYEVLSTWALRHRDYRLIARTQISQVAAGEFVKLMFGIAGIKPVGLLAGQVISQSAGVVSLVGRFREAWRRHGRQLSVRRALFAAGCYRSFPAFRLPAQCLLVFAIQAPLLLTALVYDPETTGQLGLAIMAVTLPFSLLGQAISRAFYTEVARVGAAEKARIRSLTIPMIWKMGALAVPIALLILLAGEQIFVLVFGVEWRLAGNAASILSVYLIFQFASSPLLELFNLYGGQRLFLIIYAQRAILVTMVFAGAYVFHAEFLTALGIYAAVLTIHYISVILRIVRALGPGEPADTATTGSLR